ncbi:hypothetical protein [Caldilinea sp.]|nr:hypothetical protein [Caldilinea sp.]
MGSLTRCFSVLALGDDFVVPDRGRLARTHADETPAIQLYL